MPSMAAACRAGVGALAGAARCAAGRQERKDAARAWQCRAAAVPSAAAGCGAAAGHAVPGGLCSGKAMRSNTCTVHHALRCRLGESLLLCVDLQPCSQSGSNVAQWMAPTARCRVNYHRCGSYRNPTGMVDGAETHFWASSQRQGVCWAVHIVRFALTRAV